MGSPDTTPQSEEFARENQFRLEIPDMRRLYDALDHYQQPQAQPSVFRIGTCHSKDGLFSQINVLVEVKNSSYMESHNIGSDFHYQNPKDQYWTKDQAEKVLELLSHKYGHDSSQYENINGEHYITIIDPGSELTYDLALGYDDVETAYAGDAIRLKKDMREVSKGYNVSFLNQALLEAYERELFGLLGNPYNYKKRPSSILIKPLSSSPDPFENAFPAGRVNLDNNSQEFKTFTKQTQKWSAFIEDAVNAMAKVKGIPQSGTLTLLPPQDLQQL